jgi:hypothetical protein
MLCKFSLIGAAAAALFLPLPAAAGSAFKGGATNPGGKYIYRGYGSKFHTNPGGKCVYPGWSGAPH